MSTNENNISADEAVVESRPLIVDNKELVWAKMKRFSPWPSYIETNPSSTLRKKKPASPETKCIFFFGSKDYAWIEVDKIKPYLEFKDLYVKSSKTEPFQIACLRIEEFISDPEKYKELSEPALRGRAKQKHEENLHKSRNFSQEFQKVKDLEKETTAVASKTPKLETPASTQASSLNESADLLDDSASAQSAKSSSQNNNGKSPAAARQSGRVAAPKASAKKTRAAASDSDEASAAQPPAKRARRSTSHEADRSVTSRTIARPLSQRIGASNAARQILSRPVLPEESREDVDLTSLSDELAARRVLPSSARIGFLGLGSMGTLIVRNLVHTGHKVVVWNRTDEVSRTFEEIGAEVCLTPADVVDAVDITFSCVSSSAVVRDLVFGNCGVLQALSLGNGKGYVEMTNIDDQTSNAVSAAITGKGGRYLEAQMQGSRSEVASGMLMILGAGDHSLYKECTSCFEAISRVQFFMGEVGSATKMSLLLQIITGVTLAGLSEAMALAHRSGISQQDFLELLEHTKISSPFLMEKGKAIASSDFSSVTPIQHMEKDLKMGMALAESVDQPMHVVSAVKEMFTHAKRNGYATQDISSLYIQCIL